MIDSLSNQNYQYGYAVTSVTRSVNNSVTLQPKIEVSPPVVSIKESQTLQELIPRQCETWSSRRYKDQSGDSSVSMQSPTYVPAEMAAQAVASHEGEHVRNNEEKADREGLSARSVVQINTAVCPECGRIYVSGGTTTTYYSTKEPAAGDEAKGFNINIRA